MPKFSQKSFSILSQCHIDLQTLFYEVIKHFDCIILEGYRNQIDQERAYAQGNSKLHYPQSKHNHQPSLAVDVGPYPLPDWNNTKEFIYFGGIVMGIAEMLFQQGKITHKITYGGDWNRNGRVTDQSFFDGAHFELVT